MSKKIQITFIFFLLIFIFCGCNSNIEITYPRYFTTKEEIEGYAFDENKTSIGSFVKTKNDYLFIPYKLYDDEANKEYSVIQLGFNSIGIRTNGKFMIYSKQKIVTRFYFPNSIKTIYHSYFENYNISGGVKFFYCGEIIDLSPFELGNEKDIIYVPYNQYDLFKEKNLNLNRTLLKSNVEYHLNYDNNELYYIDYYENEETIKFIPPIPERKGYLFDGWYKEQECINKWNFEIDTVNNIEEKTVTSLYAKWI